MAILSRQKTAASQAAFEQLYRRQLQPVYAYVAYRVGMRAVAEDLTSQIFEKAWRGFAGFDPQRGTASTWLFGIARNCLVDYFRQGSRQPQSLADWQQTAEAAAAGDSEAEEVWASLELRGRLADAWQALPDRQRELLSLKFGGGLNNREIAALLNLSESNVGTILYRTLTKLNQQLKEQPEGGIDHE